MPNWCNNFLQIRHDDREKMVMLRRRARQSKMLNYLVPMPAPLLDTVAGHPGSEFNGYYEKLNDYKRKLNLEHFGHADWYDWAVANWGTKWDVDAQQITKIDDNTLEIAFDTAWSPPGAVYEQLTEQGYEFTAYYYEPGMAFCGIVTHDGGDDYYNLENMRAAEVAQSIPSELDEMFCISETMAEYEDGDEELYTWVKEGAEKNATKV